MSEEELIGSVLESRLPFQASEDDYFVMDGHGQSSHSNKITDLSKENKTTSAVI